MLFPLGSEEFKKAVTEVREEVWKLIYKRDAKDNIIKTDQEWTEVCFVTNWSSHKKSKSDYRYLAIREKMAVLPEKISLEIVKAIYI